MKYILSILSLLILSYACYGIQPSSAKGYLYGKGQRDTDNLATGEWRLYAKSDNSLIGIGNYSKGLPEGAWRLFEEKGSKVAELNFLHGELDGEYRLFYSNFTPNAGGNLKTIGHIKDGLYQGHFQRFFPDGKVFVDYNALNGKVASVGVGTRRKASSSILIIS
jgi:antitoxin component YwqK of YwqJK toxin-antitoxin module